MFSRDFDVDGPGDGSEANFFDDVDFGLGAGISREIPLPFPVPDVDSVTGPAEERIEDGDFFLLLATDDVGDPDPMDISLESYRQTLDDEIEPQEPLFLPMESDFDDFNTPKFIERKRSSSNSFPQSPRRDLEPVLPSVIVTIPKAKLDQMADPRPAPIVPSLERVFKGRKLAAHYDGVSDAGLIRSYLVTLQWLPPVLANIPSKAQSALVILAIKHAHHDLGWEQVRIRVAIQELFGLKESNVKSRISKVIKASSAKNLSKSKKRSRESDVNANLDLDESTAEQAEGPPLKKPRRK